MKFDIIGDIHGCYDEFRELTLLLGYRWDTGIPIHPENRLLSFVGDITDRGPHSLKMIEIVSRLAERDKGLYSPGNHCNKLYRFMLGRNVKITHGLETTVQELSGLSGKEREKVKIAFIQLYEQAPLYQVLDEGRLIVAHAGIRADYIGRTDKKVTTFVLYGDITGEFLPNGQPVRRNWAKEYAGSAAIVYGHTPVSEPYIMNNTYNIDTGCVFGGRLTALRYPEMSFESVASSLPFVQEKFRDMDN